jgi:uncharacterized protein (DUF2062 family)
MLQEVLPPQIPHPMPKHFIRRITPNHETIRKHRHLQIFGKRLHDPNLWHINRRSSAGAFAVGLFMAFVPIPFQMVWAAGAAMIFRVNLPLSVALVWVTNPVTIPPVFLFAYLIGTWVLGNPANAKSFDFTLAWFQNGGLEGIWAPLLLGSLICGVVCSVIGYCVIRGLWRLYAVRQWEKRRQRRINP